jgi:hypothetical protein
VNAQDQLKALQQILETLNLSAARQSDESFKRDGNKHFTKAIQNTKKLMNLIEENIILENELMAYSFGYLDSLGIHNQN